MGLSHQEVLKTGMKGEVCGLSHLPAVLILMGQPSQAGRPHLGKSGSP